MSTGTESQGRPPEPEGGGSVKGFAHVLALSADEITYMAPIVASKPAAFTQFERLDHLRCENVRKRPILVVAASEQWVNWLIMVLHDRTVAIQKLQKCLKKRT